MTTQDLIARYQEIREVLESLMAWQVKNVKVWHNGAYDNAQLVMDRHDASPVSPATGVDVNAGLVERCKEILSWQKTGHLIDGALREYVSQQDYAKEHNALQIAELATARESFNFIAALSQSQAAPARVVADGWKLVVRDMIVAHAMGASCQAGLVPRCVCVKCAIERAEAMLAAAPQQRGGAA